MPPDSQNLLTLTHAKTLFSGPDDNQWQRPGCVPGRCGLLHMRKINVDNETLRAEWHVFHDPDVHEAHGFSLVKEKPASEQMAIVKTRGITIDPVRWEFLVDGKPIVLSPTEAKFLVLLAQTPDAVVRYKDIAEFWTNQYIFYNVDNADENLLLRHYIRVVLARLRKRLAPYGDVLQTVINVGIRLRIIDPGAS